MATALILTRDGQDEFHGYAIRKIWESDNREPATMNYATLYRCLDRLAERGLLSSRYDVETKNSGPPRKMFALTGAGLDAAVQLSAGAEVDAGGTVPGVI